MSVFIECPKCATKIKLPSTAVMATCTNCLATFRAVRPGQEVAVAPPGGSSSATTPEADEPEEEGAPDGWTSPWGAAAFALATLALLLASVFAVRVVTIAFAAIGLLVIVLGIRATREERHAKDIIWMVLGGGLSGLVLVLALFAPGVLNNYWAMTQASIPDQPNQPVRVPREAPKDKGTPLTAEDWAEAPQEGIRQVDTFVRLESAKVDRLAGKGDGSYMIIQLLLGNSGFGRSIPFEGFGSDVNTPVLTDKTERSHPFVEQQLRKMGVPGLVFEASPPRLVPVVRRLNLLLVFQPPPAGSQPWKLALPASAWGQTGVWHFRIPEYFQANLPGGSP